MSTKGWLETRHNNRPPLRLCRQHWRLCRLGEEGTSAVDAKNTASTRRWPSLGGELLLHFGFMRLEKSELLRKIEKLFLTWGGGGLSLGELRGSSSCVYIHVHIVIKRWKYIVITSPHYHHHFVHQHHHGYHHHFHPNHHLDKDKVKISICTCEAILTVEPENLMMFLMWLPFVPELNFIHFETLY